MNYEAILKWLDTELLGNTIHRYLVAVIVFFVLWGGLKKAKDILCKKFDFVNGFSHALFPVLALHFSTRSLHLAPRVDKAIFYLTTSFVVVQIMILLHRAADQVVGRMKFIQKDNNLATDSTRKNLVFILRSLIWISGFLFLLDNFGVNVSTFVTGLGIGGIAIALAAQNILGDAFNSFTIAIDKPFEIGDSIVVDGVSGTVEQIGFKTTRVRSIGGELLIYSNSDLTKSRIHNFKKMAARRVHFQLGVEYSTPLAIMKRIPELVKQAITSTAMTRFDRVHFFEFGDSAYIYDVVYFVESADYQKYMDIRQDINFKILEAFNSEKIAFAFPSHTVYVSHSSES